MTSESILKKWKEHQALLTVLLKEATGVVEQLERDVLPSRSSPRGKRKLSDEQLAKLKSNTRKRIVFK